MKFPPVVWTVLLIGLPLVAEWLTQYFGAAQWALPVAALLLIAAKVIEEVGKAKPVGTYEALAMEQQPEEPASLAKRIMLG